MSQTSFDPCTDRDITTRFSTGITREAMEAEAEAARQEINSFIRHESETNVHQVLGDKKFVLSISWYVLAGFVQHLSQEEEIKKSKARDELLSSEEVYYSRFIVFHIPFLWSSQPPKLSGPSTVRQAPHSYWLLFPSTAELHHPRS